MSRTPDKKGLLTITELKSLGFPLNSGQTSPNSSIKIPTKLEALTSYNLNVGLLSGYTCGQLPPEEALVSIGDCSGCTSYDIIITQDDINASDDNKVYVYYYPCGASGETFSYISFSYPGTYRDYICVQNCGPIVPFVGYRIGTNSICNDLKGSLILPTNTNCHISLIPCNTTPLVYNVAAQGFNYPTTQFDLLQTYGNIDITITITGNTNENNEIFIGNKSEGYGTTYTFGPGALSTGSTVGYISSTSKTTLDIIVYSTTTGNTFTPYNVTFTTNCPTCISCSPNSTGTTYVSGTTINVTKTGYIKYDQVNGTTYSLISSIGTYTITDCILVDTILPGYELSNVAEYDTVVTGTECGTGSGQLLTDCVEIIFSATHGFNTYNSYTATAAWIDCSGTQQTRTIIAGETFSTYGLFGSASGLPLTYGGFL